MGTNYYLIRKMEYRKDTPLSLGCESCPGEVQKLTNGFAFRGTYYPNLEELNKNFTQEIHIGKSSYGWHFSLCIYPEYGINNFEDWKKLFCDSNCQIQDEYGDVITPKEMITIITDRKLRGWTNDAQANAIFEQQQIEAHNGLCGTHYNTYDEFLLDNHAVRGNNGLWRHMYDKYCIPNPDEEATYDYIISSNDPETGRIFC